MTTTYRIAPSAIRDFELAGRGNSYFTVTEARDAAENMDRTNPLDDDEWAVWAIDEDGRITQA